MADKRTAMETIDQVATVALTCATIYVTLSQLKTPDDKTVSRARAYRGAADFYRRLAEYFGKRALRAEIAYYEEIRQ